MTTEYKLFVDDIRRELDNNNSDLLDMATRELADLFNAGYVEYTQCPILSRLAKKYVCEYCNRLHSLKNCTAYGAAEYRQLGKIKWHELHTKIEED